MHLILLGLFIIHFAATALTANAGNVRELSRECEIALALSAVPIH